MCRNILGVVAFDVSCNCLVYLQASGQSQPSSPAGEGHVVSAAPSSRICHVHVAIVWRVGTTAPDHEHVNTATEDYC